jgi:hypothetical protein
VEGKASTTLGNPNANLRAVLRPLPGHKIAGAVIDVIFSLAQPN